MVGGSEDDVERVRPLFEVMGGAVNHVGPTGAGQVVKAANQIVVALTIEAVSVALVLNFTLTLFMRNRSLHAMR